MKAVATWILLFTIFVFSTKAVSSFSCGGGFFGIFYYKDDWKCDGVIDCADGSDERNCTTAQDECLDNAFKCEISGRCINDVLRCNGFIDCTTMSQKDESDEMNCPTQATNDDLVCPDGEFKCRSEMYGNYECNPNDWKCDGEPDCLDGTDELDCDTCGPGKIRCNNTESITADHQACIEDWWVCDGDNDCEDGEDELNCPNEFDWFHNMNVTHDCGVDEFRCNPSYTSACIPVQLACNQHEDCKNGEDEKWNICNEKECPMRRYEAMKPLSREDACHHGCKHTPEGDRCYCNQGYKLEADGFTCKPEGGGSPVLYFASGNNIIKYSLLQDNDGDDDVDIASSDENSAVITKIDSNPTTDELFWVNRNDETVTILDTKTKQKTATKVPGVSSLAFDWTTNNIYISRIHGDGTGSVGIFSKYVRRGSRPTVYQLPHYYSYSKPVDIALLPSKRYLIVADNGNSSTRPHILYSDMDGDDVTILSLLADGDEIRSMTVDQQMEILYFSVLSPDGNERIMMKNLYHVPSFLDKQLLHVKSIRLSSPISSASSLSTIEGFLYIADQDDEEVKVIDSISGKMKQNIKRRGRAVTSVHISHQSLQPALELFGSMKDCSTLDCSHSCVLTAVSAKCICPNGMHLSSDLKHCIGVVSYADDSTAMDSPVRPTTSTTTPITKKVTTTTKLTTTSKDVVTTSKITAPSSTMSPPSGCLVANAGEGRLENPNNLVPIGTQELLSCASGWHVEGGVHTKASILCMSDGTWQSNIKCVLYTCNCGKGKCVKRRDIPMCQCDPSSPHLLTHNKPCRNNYIQQPSSSTTTAASSSTTAGDENSSDLMVGANNLHIVVPVVIVVIAVMIILILLCVKFCKYEERRLVLRDSPVAYMKAFKRDGNRNDTCYLVQENSPPTIYRGNKHFYSPADVYDAKSKSQEESNDDSGVDRSSSSLDRSNTSSENDLYQDSTNDKPQSMFSSLHKPLDEMEVSLIQSERR